MKYRCPFCREVFDEFKQSACPACGKAFRTPKTNEKHAKPRPTRRANRDMPARKPLVMLLSDRPRVMLWSLGLFVMVVVWGVLGNVRIGMPRISPSGAEQTRKELGVLRTALEWFRTNCGRYPTTEEGLKSLVIDPGVEGWQGYYIEALPPDVWGRPFQYQHASSNDTVHLFSMGPDGKPGTADDVPSPPPDYTMLVRRLASTGTVRKAQSPRR
jgi:general secretion pathway protein G